MPASFGIRDDDLERLASELGNTGRIMSEIAVNLGEETINLVREGFAAQADPYSRAWAPRKSGGGGRAILVDTGALRNSFTVSAGASGFTVRANQGYAKFHQYGTSRMVPRKMLPNEGDVPGKWRSRWDEVVDEILEAHFG